MASECTDKISNRDEAIEGDGLLHKSKQILAHWLRM